MDHLLQPQLEKHLWGPGGPLPTSLPAPRSAVAVTRREEEGAGSSDKRAGVQGWPRSLSIGVFCPC